MALHDRISSVISVRQANNLWKARYFSDCIGLPLNIFLTVYWEKSGSSRSVQHNNSRFLIRARRWLDRRGERLAAIWVLERGDLGGLHTHTLIHIPERLLADFIEMVPRWTDVESIPKSEWSREVGRLKGVAACGGEGFWLVQQVYDQGTRPMRYMLKGAPRQQPNGKWAPYVMMKSHSSQGIIQGKRSGLSNSLGPQARRRALEDAQTATCADEARICPRVAA